MTDTEKPRIELPVQAVACRVHGEVFRLKWPAGYLGFSLALARAAIETSEELHEATGGDAHKLNAVIAEYGPLCRLVDSEQRLEAYQNGAEISKDWAEHGICSACHKFRKGARGLFVARRGQPPLERLVCFGCLAAQGCQT